MATMRAGGWPVVAVALSGALLAQAMPMSTATTGSQQVPPTSTVAAGTLVQAPITAFPGAEGAGRFSRGGRGGDVLHVTNLNDSGAGSLRAALEAPGPRIIVFDLSGTIALEKPLSIQHARVTIAGQSAPGDGITIRNFPLIVEADDVVIRSI